MEATDCEACAAAGVSGLVDGSRPAADFDPVFGAEGSLSASEFAGENGGICGLVAVDGDVSAAPLGVAAGAPAAAARLADDGGEAGVRPATATACGVDCAEGRTGSFDFAMAAASAALSFFHQAQWGADWQPLKAAAVARSVTICLALNVMRMQPDERGRISNSRPLVKAAYPMRLSEFSARQRVKVDGIAAYSSPLPRIFAHQRSACGQDESGCVRKAGGL